MGILSIIKANWNAFWRRFEDPEKMLDQSVIDCKIQMAKCADDLSGLKAELEVQRKDLADVKAKIAKKEEAARLAVQKGNEGGARQLLTEKVMLVTNQKMLEETLQMLNAKIDELYAEYNNYVDKVRELECRKSADKMKLRLAGVQERLNNLGIDGSSLSTDSFDHYEREIDRRYEKAKAAKELKDQYGTSVESKYVSPISGVEEELQRLKAEVKTGR